MFITNVLIVDHRENASFYVGSLLFNPTSDERFLKGSQYTILPLYMSLKYRRLNMGIFLHKNYTSFFCFHTYYVQLTTYYLSTDLQIQMLTYKL